MSGLQLKLNIIEKDHLAATTILKWVTRTPKRLSRRVMRTTESPNNESDDAVLVPWAFEILF